MSSAHLASTLSCALLLAACSRPSEPPPGPGPSKASAAVSASAAPEASAAPTKHVSAHDNDMPTGAPKRPPSDNAKLIRASQILIAYQGALDAPESVTRDKEAALKLAKFVVVQAQSGAVFADLAAKYSDDVNTKANGGQLGQITRTQMTPAFTEAAFGLMVKEISDPVETAFGFHIIRRTE